jgi:hypothetical protein
MAPPATGAARSLTVLESDVASTASSSFQNVTDLAFQVIPGERYRFYALIYYTASATTIGMRLGATAPAGTLIYNASIPSGASTVTIINGASNDQGTAALSSAATAGNIAEISGICIPTASGIFQLRFAPETATANGIVIRAGSTLEVW